MTQEEIQRLIDGLMSARSRYQAKLQEIEGLLDEYGDMLINLQLAEIGQRYGVELIRGMDIVCTQEMSDYTSAQYPYQTDIPFEKGNIATLKGIGLEGYLHLEEQWLLEPLPVEMVIRAVKVMQEKVVEGS